MSSFIQMGHDSINLIGERDLEEYSGVILSPINEDTNDLSVCIARMKALGLSNIFLDPQLYFPRSIRGHLTEYPYFPQDIDTADLSSDFWWAERVNSLASFVEEFKIDMVASPSLFPRAWDDEYYTRCANTCNELSGILQPKGTKVFSTLMVSLSALEVENAALKIASITSDSNSDGYYLVISTDVDPRREISSEQSLLGIMHLINLLEKTGRPVLVSHCSSDMLLYKLAGASHCATGKFFNLRRFTQSRYDENESQGGGQVGYWFEQSLLAFLRLADILRLKNSKLSHLVGTGFSTNHWSQKLEENFVAEQPRAGIREGWRQYLSWFCKTESFLSSNDPKIEVLALLKEAETNWLALDDNNILFDEPRNNGSWVRPWRQAANAFLQNLK